MLGSVLVGAPARRSEAAEVTLVVIVNKANPATSIGASELRPIFQTTKTSWGSGGGVTPFNLPVDSGPRREFDQAVLGLDPERASRYWKDRKIRGGARAPKQLPTAAAVLAAVAADPSAIGYVSASDVNTTVKVVAKIVKGKLATP